MVLRDEWERAVCGKVAFPTRGIVMCVALQHITHVDVICLSKAVIPAGFRYLSCGVSEYWYPSGRFERSCLLGFGIFVPHTYRRPFFVLRETASDRLLVKIREEYRNFAMGSCSNKRLFSHTSHGRCLKIQSHNCGSPWL